MIKLHEFERIDWVWGHNLRRGDQLSNGNIVTFFNDESRQHVVLIGINGGDPEPVSAYAEIEVIRPQHEPDNYLNRTRELRGQPIALPAVTGQ